MESKYKREAKSVLFKEGDQATKLYLIKSGEVLCLKSSQDRLIPVFLAKENDIIGETAMISNLVSTYSAIALTDVELIEIPAENFKQVLSGAPSWLEGLTTIMISRFQQTAQLVAENRVIHPLILEEDRFPAHLEVEFKRLLD